MAGPINAGNDPDFLVSELVTNLRYPPPGVVVYWGYLGPALKRPPDGAAPGKGHENDLEPPNATEMYWRLYSSLQVNEYIEFREADVAAFQKLALSAGSAELEGGVLWLKAGAVIQHVVVSTIEVQANFLQGPMASGGGGQPARGYSYQSPMGNASWTCGQSFACGGQSFSCGGQSFACGGQSFACGGQSFACGGQSFACGGQSFACGGGSFVGC